MTQLELPSGEPADSPFDSLKHVEEDGSERWYGRELMAVMDYASWAKFAQVIGKAKASLALVQGEQVAEHHFPEWTSDGGRWSGTKVADFRLTRFGAYLTAMAGDDTKTTIAEARVYFAVQTRAAETGQGGLVPTAEMDEVEFAEHHLRIVKAKRAAELRAEAAEEKVAELEPMAAQAEHYRRADEQVAIGDFANDLAQWARDNGHAPIKHADVREYLRELGLLIRGNTIRNNEPTADAQKRGLMRIKHNVFETNHHGTKSRASARLTQKGVALVWDRAVTRIAANGSLRPSTAIERNAS